MTDTVTAKVCAGRGMTIGDALATAALLAFAGVGYWQGWDGTRVCDFCAFTAMANVAMVRLREGWV